MTIEPVTLPPRPTSPRKPRKPRKRRDDLTTKQVDPTTARNYTPTASPNPEAATRPARLRFR